MPFCKNDPNKTYKGDEPSPKGLGYCAHSEKIGKIRIGKDKNKWIIILTSKGIKRWIKYNSTKNLKINNKSSNCSNFVMYMKEVWTMFGTETERIFGLQLRKGFIFKFIHYNKFEDKETKIPDGYQKVKIEKKVIEGNYCGSKILLEKNNEEYKIIKKELKSYKTYFTHYNGGKPFLVYMKDDIYIYRISENFYINDRNNDENKNCWMYTELVKKYFPEKIFIGKSIKSEMTKFYESYSSKFDGNSILLKLNESKYVFIGNYIYEFTIEKNDKIIKYFSQVGNSGVPCPIALGEKNVYFMLDECYVSIDKFPSKMTNTDWADSYNLFYKKNKNLEYLEKYSKKVKNIKIIN